VTGASRAAFQLTMRRLLEGRSTGYLWTFTLPEVVDVAEACVRWAPFSRALRRAGWSGVRVYELHPGGHGLHVHMVTAERLPASEAWRLSRAYGWGRCDVVEIPTGAVTEYVEPYLSKAGRCGALRGRRLWARVGCDGSKVSSMELRSELADAIRAELKTTEPERVDVACRYNVTIETHRGNLGLADAPLRSASAHWQWGNARRAVWETVRRVERRYWTPTEGMRHEAAQAHCRAGFGLAI